MNTEWVKGYRRMYHFAILCWHWEIANADVCRDYPIADGLPF